MPTHNAKEIVSNPSLILPLRLQCAVSTTAETQVVHPANVNAIRTTSSL
jgi:hypothetical protein